MSKYNFFQLFKYTELTEILHNFSKSYPQLVTAEVMGKSYEGRDIWVVTVTNKASGSAEEKPALWFDGNIHATELVSATACLAFIDRLVTQYGDNEAITRLLDKRTFYVCPRLNPDGAEAALADDPKFVRSSTKPYPFDEEPVAGIVARDIDGDGRILSMRIPDNNGNWKKHFDDPRLMIRREPGEEGGDYFSLLNEGDLYNLKGDIYQHAPQKEGLDLNRNFPNWVPEGKQKGAGDAPLSEPETRAMSDFIVSHRNISIAVYGHTCSGVLLRPSTSVADVEIPTDDLQLYKMMGKKGEEITGYPAFSTFHDFRYDSKSVILGTENWFYEALGIVCWTVEYWAPHREAGVEVGHYIDWFAEHPVEDDLKMLHWSDEVLGGKGYVDWYEFDHPVLGSVELGGWNTLQSISNPPDHLIEKEISPVIDWVLWLATLTPCLELYRAEVVALGEGMYRIEFVVENTGYMSTCGTERAVEGKVTREVMVEIQLPEGCSLIHGKLRENLGHLDGRNGVPAASFIVNSVLGGSSRAQRAIVEWIVKAAKGTEIKLIAKQPRSGIVRTAVRCE